MTTLADCLDQKVKLHGELGERDSELATARVAQAALLAICLAYREEHDMNVYGYNGCQCVICGKLGRLLPRG